VIYLDSAYIAKFYLTEPDSARVKALAESEGQVCCSIVGRVEVAQVFHRKFREESINRSEARALFDQFEADCTAGLWTWLPLTHELASEAAAAFRDLAPELMVRTADAIHLASAKQHGLKAVFTNDSRMLAAARTFGLSGKSV
jgi:predicted nucleic acid-binding protein